MQKQLRHDRQQHREPRMHEVQHKGPHQNPSSSAVDLGRRHTSPLLEVQNTVATRARSAPPSEAKMTGQKKMSQSSEEIVKQREHRMNDPASVVKDRTTSNLAVAPALQAETGTAFTNDRTRSAAASSHRRSIDIRKDRSEAPVANQGTAPSLRDYAPVAEAKGTTSSSAVREDEEIPSSETDRPFKRVKSDVKSDIAPWMTQRHKRAIRRSLEAASASTLSSPATSPAKQPGLEPAEGSEQ